MIIENASLKSLNSFGLDATARYLAEVDSVDAIRELLEGSRSWESQMVLGGGSNVLFTQDFNGLIIKNNIGGVEVVSENDSEVTIRQEQGCLARSGDVLRGEWVWRN